MSAGKTWPCLLSGLRADGEEIEVIGKFSAGCERKVGGLVAEAIGAMLAIDLDLPAPEPFLINFDHDFIASVSSSDKAVADRLLNSANVAFGSRKLPPGFALLPKNKAVPQSLKTQAAEIFAFDALIQNPDRRPENPNCLLDGRNFAIFDHELAFMTEGIIGFRPPWQAGGLNPIKGPNRHVFYRELQGRPFDLSRFEGAWRALTDARLLEYRNALPEIWTADSDVANKTLSYIAQIRDNISPALAEIGRVLL
jgi:hypothetical protein